MTPLTAYIRANVSPLLILLFSSAGVGYVGAVQRFDAYPENLSYLIPACVFLLGILASVAKLAKYSVQAVDSPAFWRTPGKREFCLSALALWLYVLNLNIVGFFVSSLLFQGFFFRVVLNKRHWCWLSVIPLVTTGGCVAFFGHALSVPLPRGIGVFPLLNSWAY